ncbi:MAG: TIGR02117 family protein [Rhodospirillaceae bacterium]|nr:TIGR02117 family protein [Rhodospirillaceae bacterium]
MRRWIQRLLVLLLAAAAAYTIAALILNAVPRDRAVVTEATYGFFACDNGVHVDVALPTIGGGRDWRRVFPVADFAADVAAAPYLSLGWGARGFFAATPSWRDIRPGPVIRALFWLDRSVVHVVYHGDPGGLPHCRRLATDAAGRDRLFAFIDATLDRREGRTVREPLPGYGAHDAFYAAVGRYSLLRTCNVWSAEALRAAGQPTGLWSPFSFQIMANLPQGRRD